MTVMALVHSLCGLGVAVLLGAAGPAQAGSASIDGAPSATLKNVPMVTPAPKPAGKAAAKGASRAKPARAVKRAPHGKSARWVHRNDPPAGKEYDGVINDNVKITPFPSQASAAQKALAENRREVLADAEKAARSPSVDDRWQTVLFHLRDLDGRSDPEGCFWRLVAYYRLGQVDRARAIGDKCDLPPRDRAILEAEEAEALSLQPPVALAEHDRAPAPVANPSPYAGAPPTRLDR